ncbi:MAG: hypothetical protein OEM52_13720 [bacterium]|nr:hypothetical protein [bacterium]
MILSFLGAYSYVGYRQRSTQENTTQYASDAVRRVNLKLLAATAVNRALNELTLAPMTRTDVTGSLEGGQFKVKINDYTSDPTLGSTQVRLVACVQNGGFRDTSFVLLQYPYFSRFAYITNNEGTIWFQSGDTIKGPAHTNGYFNMNGRPAFMSSISSAQWYTAGVSPYRSQGVGPPYFAETPNWYAPTLTFPSDVNTQRTAAATAGHSYSNATLYVQFNVDGTYQTKTSSGGAWTSHAKPTNGVVFVGPASGTSTAYTVNVQGTVKGQYTLACQGSINITGDIVYATDPRVNPASTDMLGLVARLNCALTNNVLNGDRTIMAHIMTMNTSVSSTTNFYNTQYSSLNSGTLHLYGGLAQVGRGAVGTVAGMGYLKDYQYDMRLQDFSPPSYPNATVLQQIYYWE